VGREVPSCSAISIFRDPPILFSTILARKTTFWAVLRPRASRKSFCWSPWAYELLMEVR